MDYILRPAVKKDCKQLLQLIQELADYENAPDEVTVSMEEFVEAGFGENPIWEAFVIEKADKIIGMALFYIRYSTWKGRRLYLEDIVITETERRKGYGKILFEEVWRVCIERNYSGMAWQVLDWNTPAIEFYKKYPVIFEDDWLNCLRLNKNRQ